MGALFCSLEVAATGVEPPEVSESEGLFTGVVEFAGDGEAPLQLLTALVEPAEVEEHGSPPNPGAPFQPATTRELKVMDGRPIALLGALELHRLV
jgi:hypothetical protein